jgi:hypothetical protein
MRMVRGMTTRHLTTAQTSTPTGVQIAAFILPTYIARGDLVLL